MWFLGRVAWVSTLLVYFIIYLIYKDIYGMPVYVIQPNIKRLLVSDFVDGGGFHLHYFQILLKLLMMTYV